MATAGYWYWSPFLAMQAMREAAQKNDAAAFNQYVDYAKLRESFKSQLQARASGTLAGRSAGAALGALLGLAVADKVVDALVKPETVMSAMNEARLRNPGAPTSAPASAPADQHNDVKWRFERQGTDRVIASESSDSASPKNGKASFVFDRQGFANWKLTEIRLP